MVFLWCIVFYSMVLIVFFFAKSLFTFMILFSVGVFWVEWCWGGFGKSCSFGGGICIVDGRFGFFFFWLYLFFF